MKRLLPWLKIIGVLLFLWILSRIDREALLGYMSSADVTLVLPSFPLLFLMYFFKTMRWHLLVRSADLNPTFEQSWKLYNIGVFLAAITPGKIGELGRAAYLRSQGIPTGTALTIALLDRFADVIVISAVAIAGLGILFGWVWMAVAAFTGVGTGAVVIAIWRSTRALRMKIDWLAFIDALSEPRIVSALVFWTVLSWAVYFGWAVLLARSVGIMISLPILISAFLVTGVIALLPVAPSGLGTRDAALLALLAPFGIRAAQSVSLTLLMFVSIILSSGPGLWYWMRKRL